MFVGVDFFLKIAMVHVAGWVFLRSSTPMGGKLYLDNRLKNCIVEIMREVDEDEYHADMKRRKKLNLSNGSDGPEDDEAGDLIEGRHWSPSQGEGAAGPPKFNTFQKVAGDTIFRE